jgi:hypothetical protein
VLAATNLTPTRDATFHNTRERFAIHERAVILKRGFADALKQREMHRVDEPQLRKVLHETKAGLRKITFHLSQ